MTRCGACNSRGRVDTAAGRPLCPTCFHVLERLATGLEVVADHVAPLAAAPRHSQDGVVVTPIWTADPPRRAPIGFARRPRLRLAG